jgi:hypothetical protein
MKRSARCPKTGFICRPIAQTHSYTDSFASRGRVTSEATHADAREIGSPGQTFRRIRIESRFGKMLVMSTDGHLAYPFGYDITGYQVANLDETLGKAKSSGATILVPALETDDRRTALVQFPGGYIAEIHSALSR